MPKIVSFHLRYNDGFIGQKILKLFNHFAQIQPKPQFLFHKNLPPRDFSIMTLSSRGRHFFLSRFALKKKV